MSPELQMIVPMLESVFFCSLLAITIIAIWAASNFWTAWKRNHHLSFWPFLKHWHESQTVRRVRF